MSDLDDALAAHPPEPEAAMTIAPPSPLRHRHVWASGTVTRGPLAPIDIGVRCHLCGIPQNPVASQRGKRARANGNAAERRIAARHGGQRVGQYGGAPDVVVGDLTVIQSKRGKGYFSERYWSWLSALPRTGGRIPLLIVDDGGPGHHSRRIVVLEEHDWLDLFGRKATAE